MAGIIPRSKAKGTDICGVNNTCYIIRSDLGCYMRTSDLNKGSDISIFSLHPACQNGDHYIAGDDGYFFIIKGNSYRRVTDLTTDSNAEVFSLDSICQGRDYYFSAFDRFHIIFREQGIYRTMRNMHCVKDAVEYNLHPSCSNGLYYWGTLHSCFLKPASEWGYEYYCSNGFSKDEPTGVYSVHPDVLNFLPGGLAVTKGPSFGRWEKIKTITNDSNTPVTWQKKINKKVGCNKEKMTQITHNWKIATSVTAETGDLASLIAKVQMSFSAEYGGSHVSTEKES